MSVAFISLSEATVLLDYQIIGQAVRSGALPVKRPAKAVGVWFIRGDVQKLFYGPFLEEKHRRMLRADARAGEMLALHESGLTFREVGQQFGISTSRVNEVVGIYRRRRRRNMTN